VDNNTKDTQNITTYSNAASGQATGKYVKMKTRGQIGALKIFS